MVHDEARAAPSRPADFRDNPGFLLSRLGAMCSRAWHEAISQRGMSPHEFGVLRGLQTLGPVDQTEMSRALAIDPRNLVVVVDRLADAGLVAREVHPTDRRRRLLVLTEAGQELADAARDDSDAMTAEFFGDLPASDVADLTRLLARLYQARTTD